MFKALKRTMVFTPCVLGRLPEYFTFCVHRGGALKDAGRAPLLHAVGNAMETFIKRARVTLTAGFSTLAFSLLIHENNHNLPLFAKKNLLMKYVKSIQGMHVQMSFE